MPRLPPTPLAVCAQIGLIFSAAGVGGVLGALLGGGVQRRFSFARLIVTTSVLMALLFLLCGRVQAGARRRARRQRSAARFQSGMYHRDPMLVRRGCQKT